MDTPERSGAPVSKFEDSPVFNFINSLSPIQPVKSVHSVQAYTSPGFSSISSIFSSPHVNLQKESRFLIRQPYSESLKQENSSEVGDVSNQCPGVPYATKLSNCTVAAEDSSNIKCSLNEATIDPPDDCSTLASSSSLPQTVQYNCGSPDHHITPSYGNKLDPKLNVGCTQIELVQFNQDGLDRRKSLFAAEVAGDRNPTEQSEEEVPGCDWEDLISNDPDNLLIFDDSNDSKGCVDQVQKSGDEEATLSTFSANFTEDNAGDSQKAQVDASFGPCLENTTQDLPAVLGGDFGEHDESDKTPQIDADTGRNQTGTKSQYQQTGNEISDSLLSHNKVDFQQRGMRRRCLVFDISGHSKRNSLNDLSLYPSDSLPLNGKFASGSKHSLPMRRVASTSPHVLPGIGLHLNTLASTSKDKSVTPEMPASGRHAIGMPRSIGFIPPRTAKQEPVDKFLADEEALDPSGNEVQDLQIVLHDGLHTADLEHREGPGQSSPKKKRRKSDTGDGETCKRCNCKKSKCLKLYCECFAAGVYCIESCSCQGCYNKPIHEETVLATRKLIETRNPLAFAPKVIHTSETVQDSGEEANKTPASARHKRGCNCKKSSCLKKYCECYQGEVGCSPSCRCEGCKNTFGRKDGLPLMGTEEIGAGGEEMDAGEKEKDKPDEIQENAVVQIDEHQSSESLLLATPLQICRTSGKLPFFSSGKPPRSSTLPIGYSPLSNTCQVFRKSEIPLPQRKLGKNAKTVPEDDTPEILRENASPNSCVKTASPNGKRVSSPHSGIGLSPSCKGGRKLILKSIPSFPSLNTDVTNEYSVNHTGSSFSSSG